LSLAGWTGPGGRAPGFPEPRARAADRAGATRGIQAPRRPRRRLEHPGGGRGWHADHIWRRLSAGLCVDPAEGRGVRAQAPAVRDAGVVLVGLVSCIGVTVLTPPGHWGRLAAEAALVAAALAAPVRGGRWGEADRRLIRRFALLLPFFLLL